MVKLTKNGTSMFAYVIIDLFAYEKSDKDNQITNENKHTLFQIKEKKLK